MSHVLITGTGRAGTTFVVRLLTEVGADTGFSSTEEKFDDRVCAGMETHIRPDEVGVRDLPKVVKDPRYCRTIGSLLDSGLDVELVLVLVRNLDDATYSRITNDLVWLPGEGEECPPVESFVEGENLFDCQRTSLAESLGILVSELVTRGVPFRLVPFIDVVSDSETCRRSLAGVVPEWVTSEDFDKAYRKLSSSSVTYHDENLAV